MFFIIGRIFSSIQRYYLVPSDKVPMFAFCVLYDNRQWGDTPWVCVGGVQQTFSSCLCYAFLEGNRLLRAPVIRALNNLVTVSHLQGCSSHRWGRQLQTSVLTGLQMMSCLILLCLLFLIYMS